MWGKKRTDIDIRKSGARLLFPASLPVGTAHEHVGHAAVHLQRLIRASNPFPRSELIREANGGGQRVVVL